MKFALIGCGNNSRKSVIPAILNSIDVSLVVIIDRSSEKESEIVETYNCGFATSISEAVDKFDFEAIYISTPIAIHKDNILEAAKFGKHILCEKSIVENYEDALEVVSYCRKQNVALFEGFMYQFHEQHSLVRNLIDNDEIGTPFHIQSHFGFPPIRASDFRYSRKLGGGAVLDAGSYTIHFARHFFKAEPINVFSILENEGHNVEIRGTTMLNFGNSRTAHSVFGFNNMYQNKYEVWGTKGKLLLNRAFAVPSDFSPTLILEKQGIIKEFKIPRCNHFIEQFSYFTKGFNDPEIRKLWLDEILAQANVIKKIMQTCI
jgi:NDP-hexose-3-ketoreductase